MSCNHMNDCMRCGGMTDDLENEVSSLKNRVKVLETLLDIFVDAKDMNYCAIRGINEWKEFADKQKDVSPEFVKIVEENFWELLA